jgi:hypothetical protein
LFVCVSNNTNKILKWDKKEARRGDILKLTADVINLYEGSEVEIRIWEHDSDGAHDLIGDLFDCEIRDRLDLDVSETNYLPGTQNYVRNSTTMPGALREVSITTFD